jgi:stage III sporulation protein AA
MLEFLPKKIKDCLQNTNLQCVYELRLRANKETVINYNGNYIYLGEYGVTSRKEQAVVCDEKDVADCIFRAGNYSVYSVEEQIRQGFITAPNGERIGIAGEYVFEKGQPFSMRNFSSVCIRVPHEIQDCGKEIYQLCFLNGLKNLLICSPPGLGKTTILRDLSRMISEKTTKNVLICDERGEISCGDVGATCDVLKFADKQTAFSVGIRAMRPDVIITDELSFSGQYKAFAHFAPYITPTSEIFPIDEGDFFGYEVGKYPKHEEEIKGFCIDNHDGKLIAVVINPNPAGVQAELTLGGALWYLELQGESISTVIIEQ